ncbi:MAG: hypothetical protein KAG37_03985 [Flavobacteriales bacterium]|nr:hypothetical protein [Flavobacteriales bacterium]
MSCKYWQRKKSLDVTSYGVCIALEKEIEIGVSSYGCVTEIETHKYFGCTEHKEE